MKRLLFAIILLAVPVIASEKYPSIRAFGLFYNNSTYSKAQADTIGSRFDMIVLGGDGFRAGASTYYKDMVDSWVAADTNAIGKLLFGYNSTDISFRITDTTAGAIVIAGINRAQSGERDSLLIHLGASITVNADGFSDVTVTSGFPHELFFHTDSIWTSGSFGYTRQAFVATNDLTKIRSQMFTWAGSRTRYYLNFTDAGSRSAQINFDKFVLGSFAGGGARYFDGIWRDNCAFAQQNEHRSTDNPQSKTREFPDSVTHMIRADATVPGHYTPNPDDPADSVSGARYFWVESQLKMLKEARDTLRNSSAWHPTGRKQRQILNLGGQWIQPEDNNGVFSFKGDFVWRDTLYNSDEFASYVYLEHTPNIAVGGNAGTMNPGPTDGQASIDSSDWQGGSSPYWYFQIDSTGKSNNVVTIYHPGFPYSTAYKPYGISNRLYSDMCFYYLVRNDSTYLKTHAYNAMMNLEGGTGVAPGTSDSTQHVDAYTFNFSATYPVDSFPYPYATSVIGTECSTWTNSHGGAHKDLVTEVGKAGSDNWIVWRRDMPNGNIVLVRPKHTNDAFSIATPAFALGASFQQIQEDGTLAAASSTTTLRAAEGKIFTPAAGAANDPPAIGLVIINDRDSLCLDTAYSPVLQFNGIDNDGTIDTVRVYYKNGAGADTLIFTDAPGTSTVLGNVSFTPLQANATAFFRYVARDNDGDTTSISSSIVKAVDCSVTPSTSKGRKAGVLAE